MKYIFFYGTLKSKKHNHPLVSDCLYMGKYVTSNDYSLHVDGLPYMVKEPGSGVVGEVYKVDKQTLKELDALEGHPDWYRREKLSVFDIDTGKKKENVEAYIYTGRVTKGKLDIREY